MSMMNASVADLIQYLISEWFELAQPDFPMTRQPIPTRDFPDSPNPRSQANDPKRKVPSERSQAKWLSWKIRKIPSERSQAKPLKLKSPS